MTVIIIVLWVIAAILAYPHHKKWCIENEVVPDGRWTRSDVILAFVLCLVAWYAVFGWMVGQKIIDNNNKTKD